MFSFDKYTQMHPFYKIRKKHLTKFFFNFISNSYFQFVEIVNH